MLVGATIVVETVVASSCVSAVTEGNTFETLAWLTTDVRFGGALVVAAEVNDNSWAAVLTALELISPAPLEEPLLAW